MKPNIIFYLSDGQRFDTLNPQVMPNLWELSKEGARFTNSFTCHPDSVAASACLQTGMYTTQLDRSKNGGVLSEGTKTIADYFNDNGYDTAFIGEWRLADKGKNAVPKEQQGGYKYWRAANTLGITAQGEAVCVFDENGNKSELNGYRADAINALAIEYINSREEDESPFLMFVSQPELTLKKGNSHFEGFNETVESFRNYPIPEDLSFLKGNYKQEYPNYISAINRIDHNFGELVKSLKEKGLYENTVVIYTSNYGCHFKTRNSKYQQSCHDSAIHTPLVIFGGAYKKGVVDNRLVSLIDLPATMLDFADVYVPSTFLGVSVFDGAEANERRNSIFIQLCKSQTRAVRTDKYKYSVTAPRLGALSGKAKIYFEAYLYDLSHDPNEKMNLANDKNFKEIRKNLSDVLLPEMDKAWEEKPKIKPILFKRKK